MSTLIPYPYQEEGALKLEQFYQRGNHGAILADEPGLGKTVQALMLMPRLEAQHVLVVCPSKLKINWFREIQEWLPGCYCTQIMHGRTAKAATPGFPLIQIVNYDLIKDIDFSRCSYDLIIYDEAHRLRNPDAKWTQAAAFIPAKRRLMLTGTPIVNRPREVWQLLLLCGLASPHEFHEFGLRYCGARQVPEFRSRGRGANRKVIRELVWQYEGATNLEELNARLYQTCMVRRMKKDVLPELPEKTHRLVEIDRQQHTDLGALDRLRPLRNALSDLRQNIEHTLEYQNKVNQLEDDIKLAFEEIALARHDTALEKIPYALDYILSALEESEKVIVFAHHRDVLDELSEALWEEHCQPVMVRGGMSDALAQSAVDAFQNTAACRVFLGQMDACGEGLTLTAASRVIFVELPWSPSAEDQCSDRAHRIGQKDNVLVEHLVFENTIDARMAKTLLRKRKIISRSVDRTVVPEINWLSELS